MHSRNHHSQILIPRLSGQIHLVDLPNLLLRLGNPLLDPHLLLHCLLYQLLAISLVLEIQIVYYIILDLICE